MLASEIREMTDEEIATKIAQLEEERFRLRFRASTETLEDPLRLRWIRRDIARLKTVQHEHKGLKGQQRQHEQRGKAPQESRKNG